MGWCFSIVIRKYMEPYAQKVPLQIDLVIIPNNIQHYNMTEDAKYNSIGDLVERFGINNIEFVAEKIDPSLFDNLLDIIQRVIGGLVKKITNLKRYKNNKRIVIVVDRRWLQKPQS